MNIRLRGPSGTSTLQLESIQTLHDLRLKVEESTGIRPARQELRLGFPPKPLPAATADAATLSSLGIVNGESMIVSEVEEQARPPPVAAAPVSLPPATAPLPRVAAAPVAGSVPKPSTHAYEEVDGGFLVQRVVPDDNSCLFTAIGILLEPGRKDAVPYLRKLVAETIESDPETWSEPILGQSRESYMSAILGPNTWGGAIELSIFATQAKTEICSIDVQTGRIDRFGQGEGYDTRVLLIYSGIHYDALTFSWTQPTPSTTFPPPNLEFDTTIFPASSDMMLGAGLKIAAKLRATHSYTDAATFTLVCEVCGKAIVGEKEARSHAAETSHTSFGEYDG